MRILNNIVEKWASPKAASDDATADFFYPEWCEFHCETDNAFVVADDMNRQDKTHAAPQAEMLTGCDELIFDFGPGEPAAGWLG